MTLKLVPNELRRRVRGFKIVSVFLFLLFFVFYEVEVNDWIINDNVGVNFRCSQAFIGI